MLSYVNDFLCQKLPHSFQFITIHHNFNHAERINRRLETGPVILVLQVRVTNKTVKSVVLTITVVDHNNI